MKKRFPFSAYLLMICFFIFPVHLFSQNVGIGTVTPHASAALDVQSTTKGLLPPRMTTLQRDAISSPTPGLFIFNTDTQSLEVFTNTGWFATKKTNNPIEKLLGGFNIEIDCNIQKTTDGGYIIAGLASSSATGDVTGTNHGAFDCWIIKLDAYGGIVWNKLLGGTAFEYATGIQQTTDGGYIVGGYSTSSVNGDVTGVNHGSSDYWIVKLDGAGNIVWNKLLGGAGEERSSGIQQTTDGGYIVAGFSTSSASGDVTGTNHGDFDCWFVKLDANGNIVWNKLLGGNNQEIVNSIQQTTDGGYIAVGSSASSANGDVTAASNGSTDYWVIKLDAGGNITWNKLLGGNNLDIGNAILQTTDGGFLVAGYSQSSATGNVTGTNHGGSDYWIVKLNAAGNITWNKLIGGIGQEQAFSIQQTPDGGYIVAGFSQSSTNGDVTGVTHGGTDYWIVKLDITGNISWNKLLGGSNTELNPKIQVTTDGGYIVAGHSQSSATGDVKGVSHGSDDYWIVKINSAGIIIQQ